MFMFGESFCHRVDASFFQERSSDFKRSEKGCIDRKLSMAISIFWAWHGVYVFWMSIKVWINPQAINKKKSWRKLKSRGFWKAVLRICNFVIAHKAK